MLKDFLKSILKILNDGDSNYIDFIRILYNTADKYVHKELPNFLDEIEKFKDIEELKNYVQQLIVDNVDNIITYLKKNNIINKKNIQLNLKKSNYQKQLVNYMLVDETYKVYYNKLPKPNIKSTKYVKEINLKPYDCFLLNTYNNNNIFLCFNKKKVFYIYTVGLAYSKLFFENYVKLFLPKFLNFFSNINIVIYNYDNFIESKMDEYYHYDVFKVEKIIQVLEKNNLKIYNFYYDEYLKKDYIDLIKDRNNYIILDFAHLFYYSFDKSIIGDHYDNFETYEDNNINSIYFGFDNLERLNENSYLTDILEYKFFTKKEKDDIPYDITPIYYYISRKEFWLTLKLNINPDQFEKEIFEHNNKDGNNMKYYYNTYGKDELLRIITNKISQLEDNIKEDESNKLRILLEENYIFGKYYVLKNINILSLLYTKIKEWILNNISYDIYNIISEYNKIINEGFIPYLRNEWDTIFKLEDEPPHDYSGIINKTNLLKNKWRKHKKNIIEAIFIEDYKICPNPP